MLGVYVLIFGNNPESQGSLQTFHKCFELYNKLCVFVGNYVANLIKHYSV